MNTFIVITIIFGILTSVYWSMEMDFKEEFNENYRLLEIIQTVARAIKFSIDIYIHIVFILVVKFLLQYRNLMQGQKVLENQ
jgi:hypothetical protein